MRCPSTSDAATSSRRSGSRAQADRGCPAHVLFHRSVDDRLAGYALYQPTSIAALLVGGRLPPGIVIG
jgi:hypothetical protein